MTRRFRLVPIALLLALLCGATPAWAQQPPEPGGRIRDLSHRIADGELFVSFRLDGAFTESVEEKLHGSRNYEFRHTVRLIRRRGFWFARTLTQIVIRVEVSWDNLTKRYALRRYHNEDLIEERETDSGEEMRRFMTEVKDLRLIDMDDVSTRRKVTIRVQSTYESTSLFFFVPWSFTATAEREVRLRP